MIKTITIGDLHGSDLWKDVNPNDYDKIIFTGDYVDSFERTDKQIEDNLMDVIAFKEGYPDKVVLLWGNHDVQYLHGYDRHGCSGYRTSMSGMLYCIFDAKKKLFRLAHQIDNTVWTHAGIHQYWWDTRFNGNREEDIAEQLNNRYDLYDLCLFDVGHLRGGYHHVGGPLWADKREIKSGPLMLCNQIVGHSKVERFDIVYKHNREIVFVDNQNKDGQEFYEKQFKDE